MNPISVLYNDLVAAYTFPGLLLMAAIIILLAIQLYYYLGPYGRIPAYRTRVHKSADQPAPYISVVVVIRDEQQYIENILPQILEQQYPNFEVIAVDLGSEAETSELLADMALRYPHLHVTRLIQQELRFPITPKMALNVGIKAAAYSNILLTTTEARPASPKWIALMARGFLGGEVVIGYCGIEPRKGIVNRFMRAGRLNMSIRYLASAIGGRTYRGIAHNIGYTAGLYFSTKGFDHLNLDMGDDDLFIQRIASQSSTSIIMNPHASTLQTVWGGASDWFRRQIYYHTTWKHYPQQVKNYIEWETWSRALFFAAAGTAIACMPFEISVAAAALVVLRLVLVEVQIWRICRRLGERGLGMVYAVYDLFSPLYALALWFAGCFRSRSKWK